MKLLWNSLLISLGILLPTSTSVVLAESLKPSESVYVIASTATEYPETVVIPETTQELPPPRTVSDHSSPAVETIVIPDTAPASTPTAPITEEGEAVENVETTDPNQNSTTETEAQTGTTENADTTTPDSENSTAETETTENTEITDSPSSDDSTEAKEPELTPEELARQQKLIEADQLYLTGQIEAAQQLYREAKDPFTAEAEVQEQSAPIYDTAQLTPAGSVYWRQSEAGLEQKLETKILAPLRLLVEQYPEFIPGHLRYAQALEEYGREEESLQVLERATTLYPNEPELLKATIRELGEADKWLEASLTARQFALLHPDSSQAGEFTALAEENLERYRSHLRRKLRGNAIANAITGTLGFILTGNLFGPVSAIDTTVLMLRGESAVGESVANRARKQLPMLEDEEVLAYVREVGNKLATVASRDDFEYEFYVVMDDKLNAFALPGGKVFINAGAILKTRSEAELAGLLAHELSHAVLSHGFQLVTEGNLIANVTSYFPYGGTAANLIVLDYNRDMERQADALGSRILVSSGYAADGMRNLMVTLDKEEREEPVFAWLSTHPDTQERINNMESLIERNGYNRYAYEGVGRHIVIQERVAKLLKEYERKEEED